jgi:3'(2'), 5'-bisphosphate nucleotidase
MPLADTPVAGRPLYAALVDAALEAGSAIMEVYAGDAGFRQKADCTPVTIADERAEAIICARLAAAAPGVPIVAEEAVSAGIVPPDLADRFFLVDPLDGTKEFIHRRTDFTVNIALVENGVPVIGVVYAPALGAIYFGAPEGAWYRSTDREADGWRRISVRTAGVAPVAVASRSHRDAETDRFLRIRDIANCVSIGSSLKFCLIAEGEADIYPRFSRTMEWDTAAGDAVLRAAGGMTYCADGSPFVYGKRGRPDDTDFANPHFVAKGA